MGTSRRRSAMVAALAASVLACALVAAEGVIDARSAIRIPFPTTSFEFRASASPRALPERVRAPVRLTIAGEVKSEASSPPAMKKLVLDLDRSFAFDLRSLSPCGGPRLDRAFGRIGGRDEPEQVRARCPSSIAAEGTVEFLLRFPENVPIPVHSDLTLLKGDDRAGVTTLFLHAYLPIPTPQAVIAPVELRKIREGRYGTRATVSLPKIAGGAGAVTSFRLAIPRRTLVTGQPLSVASLRCADGRFQIRATSSFADGTTLAGTAAQTCAIAPAAG